MSTFMVTTTSVIRARSSSRLAGRAGTNTLSLTYPHIVNFRGVNSGDRGGQAIVHVQSKLPPWDWCRK